jgi:hypothetical protein
MRSFLEHVITAKIRTHSSVFERFQFSQTPASANGSPDFMPMAYGCFAFAALRAGFRQAGRPIRLAR